jgi:hypothetical protein
MAATTIRPCVQNAQQHVASHGGNGDQASCASAQQHVALHGSNGGKALCTSTQRHVTLHSSDNNKNRVNKDDKVVHEALHSRHVAPWQQQQQLQQ